MSATTITTITTITRTVHILRASRERSASWGDPTTQISVAFPFLACLVGGNDLCESFLFQLVWGVLQEELGHDTGSKRTVGIHRRWLISWILSLFMTGCLSLGKHIICPMCSALSVCPKTYGTLLLPLTTHVCKYVHEKGITDRDLKPEVRLLG